MAATKRHQTEFRSALRRGRESRRWSQAFLAKLLQDKGVSVYATTITKIEAGDRAAQIDEIVAIAELFEVSVDTLLGRDTSQVRDKDYLLLALTDSAMRAKWQISSTEQQLRSALADMSSFDLRGPEKTVADGCAVACDAMADAVTAIHATERAQSKIYQAINSTLGGKAK
jgi:transcriptional regulator with XRE-family HTH domain